MFFHVKVFYGKVKSAFLDFPDKQGRYSVYIYLLKTLK